MRYELKPCPFCGGDAYFGEEILCGELVEGVHCRDCEAVAAWNSGTKESCINTWNTRSITPKQQLADEMFDMLEHLLNVENLWHDYKSIEDLLSRARGEHHEISTNSQQED